MHRAHNLPRSLHWGVIGSDSSPSDLKPGKLFTVFKKLLDGDVAYVKLRCQGVFLLHSYWQLLEHFWGGHQGKGCVRQINNFLLGLRGLNRIKSILLWICNRSWEFSWRSSSTFILNTTMKRQDKNVSYHHMNYTTHDSNLVLGWSPDWELSGPWTRPSIIQTVYYK